MLKKAIGSVLMILGTSVGAGMLALPMVTASEHYIVSLVLLCLSWLIMTLGALCLLEVNVWLSPGTNLISMARMTLGPLGKYFTWVIYLLLMYSLLCAYLSGMSDILIGLFATAHIKLPHALAIILCLGVFGVIISRGIATVDFVNRAFMSIKLLAYLALIILVARYIDFTRVTEGNFTIHSHIMMVMLVSFGYAIIIPSLRTYLNNDILLLRKVVIIGSILPLIMYALWILTVQGVIPRGGQYGLLQMLSSNEPNSLLMKSMNRILHTPVLTTSVNLFVSICAVTSFLGVSVCLTDFIADGLSLSKKGRSGWWIYSMSFLPPLIIVLWVPGVFIRALDYGGILCLILLIILPLAMFCAGRYHGRLRYQAVVIE